MTKHAKQQKKWKLKNPEYYSAWKKSFVGYFKFCWSRIKYRCRSQKRYLGLPYMDKKDWSHFLKETYYQRINLWDKWRLSDYQRRLAPSIDRIDSTKGYLKSNCRWLTQWENSSNKHGKKGWA